MRSWIFTAERPQLILSGAFVFAILTAWLCIWLVTTPGWLGLTLSVKNDQVMVEQVNPYGPSGGYLQPGDVVSAITTLGSDPVPIDAVTLIEEPDLLPSYDRLNQFYQDQSIINQLLTRQNVMLLTSRGYIELAPDKRPIASLPFSFWFQLICGMIALMAGASIWVFQFDSFAARSYALNGLSFLIVTFSAAVYSSRELAISGEWFQLLGITNHLGAMIFTGAFVGLLFVYPTPLGKPVWINRVIAIYLIGWVLDTLQWLPSTDWAIRLPVVFGLLLSMIFGVLQWRESRLKPLERASLKWFLFSLFIAGGTFVAVLFVTVLFGLPPPVSQGYAFGIVTLMYLGIALGISRYKLFNLERWWFNVWAWFIAGALVIGFDLLLVYFLHFSQSLALGVTLALSGWLYFPARQWLMHRLVPGTQNRIDSMFPQLLQIGLKANDPEELQQDWQKLLEDTFSPLRIDSLESPIESARLGDNGQSMDVPGLDSQNAIRLNYPFSGHRLFSPDDVSLSQGLWDLAQRAVTDRRRYEDAVINERERIHRDLHDDVGAKLLSLTYRGQNVENVDLARSALQDLRDVVSHTSREDLSLPQALAEWYSETFARLEAIDISLEWNRDGDLPETPLHIQQTMNIGRILREAISNAIKHAQPTKVWVDILVNQGTIRLSVQNDGRDYDPQRIGQGRGTKNMKKRSEDLGGDIQWSRTESGNCLVECQFPLELAPVNPL